MSLRCPHRQERARVELGELRDTRDQGEPRAAPLRVERGVHLAVSRGRVERRVLERPAGALGVEDLVPGQARHRALRVRLTRLAEPRARFGSAAGQITWLSMPIAAPNTREVADKAAESASRFTLHDRPVVGSDRSAVSIPFHTRRDG
jgi:hypothetical protein